MRSKPLTRPSATLSPSDGERGGVRGRQEIELGKSRKKETEKTMLLKKPTFYLAVAGTGATIVMVAHLNGQSLVKPPPIDPLPKPYALKAGNRACSGEARAETGSRSI